VPAKGVHFRGLKMEILGEMSETTLRIGLFISIFVVMALLELLIPKRELTASKSHRWLTNLALVGVNTFVVRFVALIAKPLVAFGAALYAQSHGWGLFNLADWPFWLEVLLCVVILDFLIWFQHLVFHKFPILWRLHQVHHADVDIDVTTGTRFHPVEIMLSMIWKVLWVLLLGISPVAVVIFEAILNGGATFNHANVALPKWLDQVLRLVIVTPDMHRVHHSVLRAEHDSNYGFNLSIWDRIFRTYTAQPSAGHQQMTIGLTPFQSREPTQFLWSLRLPFAKMKGRE